MREFIDNLFINNLVETRRLIEERLEQIVEDKLEEMKILVSDKFCEELNLDEGNIQKMGRTKLYKVRIRKGKVQRRIRKSDVAGFVYRGGKLVRMTPIERRHRKVAARLSKFKRSSKMQQSLRKRTRAIQKRRAMGI